MKEFYLTLKYQDLIVAGYAGYASIQFDHKAKTYDMDLTPLYEHTDEMNSIRWER